MLGYEKNLFKKNFGVKIMVRRKNSEKMFSRKTFWSEKIWYKKFFGRKNFCFFVRNKIFDRKNFLTGIFLLSSF